MPPALSRASALAQERRILAALSYITANPTMSIRKVADLHKVPRTTLTRRMRGSRPRAEAAKLNAASRRISSARVLSDEEEKQVLRYVELLEEMGLELRLTMLTKIAVKIVSRREDRARRGDRVGESWVQGFLGRWKLGRKFGRPETGEWEDVGGSEEEEVAMEMESEDESDESGMSAAPVVRRDKGKEKEVVQNSGEPGTPQEAAPAPVVPRLPRPDADEAEHLTRLTALLHSSDDIAEVRRLALQIADIAGQSLVHVAVIEGMVDQFNSVLCQLQGEEDDDTEEEGEGEVQRERDHNQTEEEGVPEVEVQRECSVIIVD
ncbi:hypothetical protein K440DRAFT_619871 [Wilcoxina mikolae CBS 423.85]|nr:hypothetical protein K440DRAFT_619871 [Wilcoxina mikolae CBS 423.85]